MKKTMERTFQQNLLAMLGLCFVLIMVALDQTVIGTALPTVVAELNGFDLYAWVGTAYLLTSVITVPVFGKLGDEHSRKPFVVAAIVLFTLASMLCGIAESMLQLVLARALQGIGGGMLVATSFASVPDLFPEARERLRWQILFSTAFGLANAIGPTLGGYLAQYWGWRWVFFVNLPVGVASLVFVWFFLPRIRHSDRPPSRMDWIGALLIATALGSLQLLTEWLPQHKPVFLLFALGLSALLSVAALLFWEKRCANPLFPLAMFTHRALGPLFTLAVTMGFCMFAILYYAPLLFQGGFGLMPNEAGLLVTPLAVFITVGSIVNGRIVTKLQAPNALLHVGLGLFLMSTLALTQTSPSTSHGAIALTMITGGLGLGMLLHNLTLMAQYSIPRTQLGVATAMLQSMRMVGNMMGTALAGALISNLYAARMYAMLELHRSAQWSSWLADPQILVDRAKAARFIANAGLDANTLLTGARDALIDAIHGSQWMIAGLLALSFYLVRRIPPISIHRVVDQPIE